VGAVHHLLVSDVVDVSEVTKEVTVTAIYLIHPRNRRADYLTVHYRLEQRDGRWVVTKSDILGQS
jgi:hypothetical protein